MSESKVEEIISALWLIAALLAYICGFKVFSIALGIKAILDFGCVHYHAWKEIKRERDVKPNTNTEDK